MGLALCSYLWVLSKTAWINTKAASLYSMPGHERTLMALRHPSHASRGSMPPISQVRKQSSGVQWSGSLTSLPSLCTAKPHGPARGCKRQKENPRLGMVGTCQDERLPHKPE